MIEMFSITMTEEVEYNKNDIGLLDKDNVGLIVGLSPISSQSSGNDITVSEYNSYHITVLGILFKGSLRATTISSLFDSIA